MNDQIADERRIAAGASKRHPRNLLMGRGNWHFFSAGLVCGSARLLLPLAGAHGTLTEAPMSQPFVELLHFYREFAVLGHRKWSTGLYGKSSTM